MMFFVRFIIYLYIYIYIYKVRIVLTQSQRRKVTITFSPVRSSDQVIIIIIIIIIIVMIQFSPLFPVSYYPSPGLYPRRWAKESSYYTLSMNLLFVLGGLGLFLFFLPLLGHIFLVTLIAHFERDEQFRKMQLSKTGYQYLTTFPWAYYACYVWSV